MARWKLMKPHYLNTVDNEWEYRETSRNSGRQAAKRFKVPRYFDPEDPSDCDRNGECIVSHEGKGMRGDHIFFGDPTPEMLPLDAEAEKISEALEAKWQHPIDSLPNSGDYSQSLIATFERQMQELITRAAQGASAPAPVNVPAPDGRIAALEKQVAELTALLQAVTGGTTFSDAPAKEPKTDEEHEQPSLPLPAPKPQLRPSIARRA